MKSKKTPALMIQGTTSNAGKSILVTAFCRIFTRYGFNVSPFKAQNMSLNSYVTHDNCEIGRAQAVQATACKKVCDVRMNPVLLKPDSKNSSQIIVMGKPVKQMQFRDYIDYKKKIELTVHKAYDELADDCDLMIIEGAGSPAEVNLKANDIVNMAMAKYADANVLICGDIDRGGVYAHFLGTFLCLDKSEQDLVKGFIVNKFRGDDSLLGSAHDFIIDKTGKPVIGVVPYIEKIAIPDEDSVSFKDRDDSVQSHCNNSLHIALIDLPYISNATDIDPLKNHPDVFVSIVKSVQDLDDDIDVIIIPGSKNVINDQWYLDKSGISDKIISLYKKTKVTIIGICGGFQILGIAISDPFHIESTSDINKNGIGILDITTSFEKDKTLSQTTVIDKDTNTTCKGYEIHHGKTVIGNKAIPIHFNSCNEPIGAKDASGRVWGTYLHGIFDNDEFRYKFIDNIRQRKNLGVSKDSIKSYDIDMSIDRLADHVEKAVDMEFIRKMLGI